MEINRFSVKLDENKWIVCKEKLKQWIGPKEIVEINELCVKWCELKRIVCLTWLVCKIKGKIN